MRRLGLLILLALAGPLTAGRTWYVNRGVPYHLGDGRFSRSEDALFMQTKNVVGPRWEQSFTVDRPDTVHVRIEHIWGVDDCPYCKVIISIDGKPMARLFAENNRTAFTTPDPLAVPVRPGRVHVLSIESVGGDTVDDFVIQDVVVETAVAEVKLLPGPVIRARAQAEAEPEPEPTPRPQPACGALSPLAAWPEAGTRMAAAQPVRLDGPSLDPGRSAGLEIRVLQVAAGDPVGQAIELRAGGDLGWALNLAPGSDRVVHADRIAGGVHRAARWDADGWRPGKWNRLEIQRCRDGAIQLYLNGRAAGLALAARGRRPLELRLLGLEAEIRPLGAKAE